MIISFDYSSIVVFDLNQSVKFLNLDEIRLEIRKTEEPQKKGLNTDKRRGHIS